MLRTTVLVTAILVVAACTTPEVSPPGDTTSPGPVTATPTSTHAVADGRSATDAPFSTGRAAPLPAARTEVTGTAWDGRIVAVGGLDPDGDAVADVDVYDPDTDTWSQGPRLPTALHHTAVATLDDRLYVVGGYSIQDGSWVAESAVWSLGPGDDRWSQEAPLATPRGALAVASTGERLVAVGGVGPDGQVLTSTEVLDRDGRAWEPGPEMGTPREHLAATAVGGEVYAIAGRAGGFDTNRDSVEVLRDRAWSDAGTLNAARGGIGAATVDRIPCVTGGEEDAGTIGSVECLVAGSWEVVDRLEVPRHGLAVAALDGRLHVVGGGPEPRLTTSDVHEVIPVSVP